ncbi:ABC transporter permease [Streptobacillus ratti]|uniref:ABC transporter permease n=1 Tax=Streptobacillus ratti TaxID=1720557 RepID=UPI000A570A3F|nr:ABC-2 family transporter protein [Streptobacillus ratti]
MLKYIHIIKMVLKSNLVYKANFMVGLFNQLLIILFEFLGLLSLFNKFGSLNNWKLTEVFLLYGIINFSFSFSEVFFRGFESNIQSIIREGKYDRYLLRPYSTLLQISAYNFQPVRIGRLLLAIFVLIIGLFYNFEHISNIYKLIYLLFVLASSTSLYAGIYIAVGSLTFLFTQYIEFTGIFIQGSVSMMQYPKDVFPKYIQDFFSYILPVTLVSYYPISIILNKIKPQNNYLDLFFPLAGILFFVMSYLLFKKLEKKYSSVGN